MYLSIDDMNIRAIGNRYSEEALIIMIQGVQNDFETLYNNCAKEEALDKLREERRLYLSALEFQLTQQRKRCIKCEDLITSRDRRWCGMTTDTCVECKAVDFRGKQ